MAILEIWTYREQAHATMDLTGFTVEAKDGKIGKIDEASYETGNSYLVVQTGPWIFGKTVMLPAGIVDSIDPDTETVFVNLTKDEIKNAPEFDEKRYKDEPYRQELASYYNRAGLGDSAF
jgi:hypothetical protein